MKKGEDSITTKFVTEHARGQSQEAGISSFTTVPK